MLDSQSNLRRHTKVHTNGVGKKTSRGRKERGSTDDGEDGSQGSRSEEAFEAGS